jgi:hypothetical protein
MHDPKAIEAMARAGHEADAQRLAVMGARDIPAFDDERCALVRDVAMNRATAALTALCTLYPSVAAILRGEATSEAEAERDELFNRLGRVTSELGLSMDCTAGRIIEAIHEMAHDMQEACASVSVKVDVPEGAESWSPLEAWEEALLLCDQAFRDAIRALPLPPQPAATKGGQGDE